MRKHEVLPDIPWILGKGNEVVHIGLGETFSAIKALVPIQFQQRCADLVQGFAWRFKEKILQVSCVTQDGTVAVVLLDVFDPM